MIRIRRYRFFLIFTVIFVLAIFRFGSSNDWTPNPKFVRPIDLEESSKSDINDSKKHDSSIHYVPSEVKPPVLGGTSDKESSVDEIEKPLPDLDHATMVAKPSTTKTAEHADLKTPEKTPEKAPEKALEKTPPDSHAESFSPIVDQEYEETPEPSLPTPTKSYPHWEKLPEHFPVSEEELIGLPTDRPKSLPKLQAKFKDESSTEKIERLQKLGTIKEAFQHSWMGYKLAAMGHDEVRPVSGGFRDPFAGWGATLVDALDTLWIMGLKDEFSQAVDEIKKIDFTTTPRNDIPLFETVIRYLGGLIGAYDISGHRYSILLEKAVQLAEILMGAFDTPNRMPLTFYYWHP
jgi:mannosyl-oligosaccharide alpha-1,2-mannosidase